MLRTISQSKVERESLTGLMWTWCVHAASVKANGSFAALEARQGYPDRGWGLWNRRL